MGVDDPIRERPGCAPLRQEDHHVAQTDAAGFREIGLLAALPAHRGEGTQARGLGLQGVAVGVDDPGVGIGGEEQIDEHQIEGGL